MTARGRRIVKRSLRSKIRDRTDWKRLRTLTDDDIERAIAEDPNVAPSLDAAWFAAARIVEPIDKERITIRLDRDILEYFRQFGSRYQTRINSVLRAFVEQTRRKRKDGRSPSHFK